MSVAGTTVRSCLTTSCDVTWLRAQATVRSKRHRAGTGWGGHRYGFLRCVWPLPDDHRRGKAWGRNQLSLDCVTFTGYQRARRSGPLLRSGSTPCDLALDLSQLCPKHLPVPGFRGSAVQRRDATPAVRTRIAGRDFKWLITEVQATRDGPKQCPPLSPLLLLPFHICSSGFVTGTLLSSRLWCLPLHFSTRSLYSGLLLLLLHMEMQASFSNILAPVSSPTKWGWKSQVLRKVSGRVPPTVLSEMAHFPSCQCCFSGLICSWGLQLSPSHMLALEGGEHPKNKREPTILAVVLRWGVWFGPGDISSYRLRLHTQVCTKFHAKTSLTGLPACRNDEG